MSKRRIILVTLIPLLILVGAVAFKLWAAEEQKKDEEILAVPKKPVASATAEPTKEWVDAAISFDGSESEDEDTKVWKEWDDKEKKYVYKRKLIAGKVEKWEWDFGDGNSGEGETTTHTYTEPDVSEKGHEVELTITADHEETASATTLVRIWPEAGEVKITGPRRGWAGVYHRFTAHVWDTHGGKWGGSKYPDLKYSWWECGTGQWTAYSSSDAHSFRWYPPLAMWHRGEGYPLQLLSCDYIVQCKVQYPGPNGGWFPDGLGEHRIKIFGYAGKGPGPKK